MYLTKESATDCIQAVNDIYIDDFYIKYLYIYYYRASYGTTKYCKYFLSNRECHSPNCLYYHTEAPENMCFIKEETIGYNPEFYDASHPIKIPNKRNKYYDKSGFPEPKWYITKNQSENDTSSKSDSVSEIDRSVTPPITENVLSFVDSHNIDLVSDNSNIHSNNSVHSALVLKDDKVKACLPIQTPPTPDEDINYT